MMVPRSYLYAAPRNRSATENEKDDSSVRVQGIVKKSSGKKPSWIASAPPATPSKPVVIPSRTRDDRARRAKGNPSKTRSASGTNRYAPELSAVPEATAAQRAIHSPLGSCCQTEGHQTKGQKHQRLDGSSNRSFDGKESFDPAPRTLSATSPQSWSVLLSPPDELDPEDSSVGSDMSLGAAAFIRSPSSDSMPSLDTDYGSSPCTSGVSTPGVPSRSRSYTDRTPKEPSCMKTEPCPLNHPLLSFSLGEVLEPDAPPSDVESASANHPSSSGRKLGFKSNLTASFAMLRTAARSLSNFTAPAISRDEYLTRSLLPISPPFTDERRPPPLNEPPDPALRRYLNPTTASATELHCHGENIPREKAPIQCTTSVQLQTYQRAPRLSSKASAPPTFASSNKANAAAIAAADRAFAGSLPRQRELRENSDFLRVIVLEMNMRRNGTMSDTTPGKARMWLPARQLSNGNEGREEDGVPRRWIGFTRQQIDAGDD